MVGCIWQVIILVRSPSYKGAGRYSLWRWKNALAIEVATKLSTMKSQWIEGILMLLSILKALKLLSEDEEEEEDSSDGSDAEDSENTLILLF